MFFQGRPRGQFFFTFFIWVNYSIGEPFLEIGPSNINITIFPY